MSFRPRTLFGLFGLVSMAATSCGSEANPPLIDASDAGEQAPTIPSPSAPDASTPAIELSLALAPPSTVLSADEAKTIAITVRGNQGQSVDLGIDNVPLGVSAFIDPLVSSGSATLTISAGSAVVPGKFVASVRAQAGSALARAAVEIELVAPVPSFDATLAPSAVTASPGDVVGFAISVARRGGFTGPLTVTSSSLPLGLEADAFTIPAGATSGVLNVRTHPMLAPTNASFEVDVASETLGTKTLQASIALSPRPGTLDASFGQGGTTYHTAKIPTGAYERVALIDENGWIALSGAVDDSGVEHRFGVTALSADGAFWWNGWTSLPYHDGLEWQFPLVRAIAPIDGFGQFVVVGDTDPSSSRLAFAAFGNQSLSTVKGILDLDICPYGSSGRAVFVSPATSVSPWSAFVAGLCSGTMLSRWRADATLDPTFGTNGIKNIAGPVRAIRMANVRHGGTFVVGVNSDSPPKLVVSKAGGSNGLDPTYGAGGVADTGVEASDVYAVDADPNGWVLVAIGLYVNGKPETKLVRLTPSGTLDASFGTGGVASVGLSRVQSLAQRDGRILVGGAPDSSGVAVVAFLDNGQLDTSFGLGGTAKLLSTAELLAVRSIAGRIVVVSQDWAGVYVSKLWQ